MSAVAANVFRRTRRRHLASENAAVPPLAPAPVRSADVRVALFRYGFRPFFLGAAIHAAIAVPVWVHAWSDGGMPAAFDALWHGHEMIFGFAAAALAGFLLTAVPSWTGAGPLRGLRLATLFAIWLAARVLAFVPASLAAGLFAAVDLAFLPVLGLAIAPGILARGGRRNAVFIVLLTLLTGANAVWHADTLGLAPGAGLGALHFALGIFAVMIAVIGGRIVPAFTIGGLRMAGSPVEIAPAPRLDLAAILAVALVALAPPLGVPQTAIAILAAAAAALNAVRLARWQGWRARALPLVWILHLGYAWLVAALALTALAAAGLVAPMAATHALGAGAAGTMILAVMSRAALGHTGRELRAGPAAVLAYALVTAGALARVAAVLTGGDDLAHAAGVLWAGGFAAFAIGYAPILLGPRPDGRPG